LEKEMRVYDLLDSLSIRYERVDHAPLEYMEEYLDIKTGAVSVLGRFLEAVHHDYTVVHK
jgi:hypothetical protein